MRRNFLHLLLALSLVLGCMYLTALAAESGPRDESIPADGGTEQAADVTLLSETGTWGGIQWSLSTKGVLTISAAPGVANSGVMPSGQTQAMNAPWLTTKIPIITLNIQEGVTNIGDYIFSNDLSERYPNLTTVTLPNSLTSIGSNAFYTDTGAAKHSALQSIQLPPSLSYLGEKAFWGCTELTSTITIPGTCKTVANSAFAYTSITGLNLSEGVETIGMSAFVNCTNLSGTITLPSSIKNVYQDAFANCGAESVHINSTAGAEFGGQVFKSCQNLKEVIIAPNSITEIPNHMFSNCAQLTSVSLPEGITSIGNSAFYGCTALQGIQLPNSLLTLGSAFWGCTSLKSLTIPNKVREVVAYTFSDCSALETVVLGEQVSWVHSDAFLNSSPQNMILYYNLLIVDDNNFNGASAMNVIFYGTKEEWDELCDRLTNNNRLTSAAPTIIPIIRTEMKWSDDEDTDVSVAEAAEKRMPLELTLERPAVEGVTEATPVSAMVAAYDEKGRMLGVFSCEVDQTGAMMNITLPTNAKYIKIMMVNGDSIAPLLSAKSIF